MFSGSLSLLQEIIKNVKSRVVKSRRCFNIFNKITKQNEAKHMLFLSLFLCGNFLKVQYSFWFSFLRQPLWIPAKAGGLTILMFIWKENQMKYKWERIKKLLKKITEFTNDKWGPTENIYLEEGSLRLPDFFVSLVTNKFCICLHFDVIKNEIKCTE